MSVFRQPRTRVSNYRYILPLLPARALLAVLPLSPTIHSYQLGLRLACGMTHASLVLDRSLLVVPSAANPPDPVAHRRPNKVVVSARPQSVFILFPRPRSASLRIPWHPCVSSAPATGEFGRKPPGGWRHSTRRTPASSNVQEERRVDE